MSDQEMLSTAHVIELANSLSDGYALPEVGSTRFHELESLVAAYEEARVAEFPTPRTDFVHRMGIRNHILKPYFEHKIAEEDRLWYPNDENPYGYLGWDEKWEEVVERDIVTMDEYDVHLPRLGRDLFHLMKDIRRTRTEMWVGLNRDSYVHRCPFSDCSKTYEEHSVMRRSYVFQDPNSDESLCVPGIYAHLGMRHSFFGGLYAPERVDVVDLFKLIELG